MVKINTKNLKKDILSGVVVALVSIPISMGYAQVAGLPVVYGLYGSLLPIFIFSLITTSPQFVVGVDAMPAAMVGGSLASLGIVSGSEEATKLVPAIAILTALWLFLFSLLRLGRIVKYISTPVMGGFISGVGCTIILMLVPKLFGGDGGTGELFVLLAHIASEFDKFNWLSALLGGGTIAILLVCKKIAPKFPMSAVMMVIGAGLTAIFHVDEYGVKLLPQVTSGLPKIVVPDLRVFGDNLSQFLLLSLTIALVVMAQTLLATNNYAMRFDYKVDNNQELIGYAAANLAGGLVGCCPINGSVSRTGLAVQFGCQSQMMSIAASVTMLLVLLFGTDFLAYLPIPVLTGIVICALIGILEIAMAKKLWKVSKNEFFIFTMAFLGVLVFGTIYGVMIGVLLSFCEVVIRAVIPPKGFLGMIPGHEGFYHLQRNRNAVPIAHTVIYRFGGNLFFANINAFQEDIESAIQEDTRQVIVDASGIGNIDITAADRLVILQRKLKQKGIRFYLTEHVGTVNDQLRMLGAGSLIEEGAVRRTISLALRDAGIEKPYPLEGVSEEENVNFIESSEKLAEFEWIFGSQAEEKIRQMAKEIVNEIMATPDVSLDTLELAEKRAKWGRIGLFDEDELLDDLEMLLEQMAKSGQFEDEKAEKITERIEQRRTIVKEKLKKLNPRAAELLQEHKKREENSKHFSDNEPPKNTNSK